MAIIKKKQIRALLNDSTVILGRTGDTLSRVARMEHQITPPSLGDSLRQSVQNMGLSLQGKSGYPPTIYTMVRDIYERAQKGFNLTELTTMVSELTDHGNRVHADYCRWHDANAKRGHEHAQSSARAHIQILNKLKDIDHKIKSYDPSAKDAIERDSLTNGMAKLRVDVDRVLGRLAADARQADSHHDIATSLIKETSGNTATDVKFYGIATQRMVETILTHLAEVRTEMHGQFDELRTVAYQSRDTVNELENRLARAAQVDRLAVQIGGLSESMAGKENQLDALHQSLGEHRSFVAGKTSQLVLRMEDVEKGNASLRALVVSLEEKLAKANLIDPA